MARNDGKRSYTYDLGACWEHEITLEQTFPRDRGQDYPVCVAYKGDSPVEYWCEDDPEEPEPFDRAEVNRKRRHRPVRASAPPAERQDHAGPVPGRPARSDRG